MSIVTIIPGENHVYVDGVVGLVDGTNLVDPVAPSQQVHAIHWNGSVGWIEYVNDPFDTVSHVPNRTITDFTAFQPWADAWTTAQAQAAPTNAQTSAS